MSDLVQIVGHRIVLTPVLKSEIQSVLLPWRNSADFQDLCSNRRNNVDFHAFEKELAYDFSHDRHEQYLIRKKQNKEPIGTIFSYNYNRVDEYIFVTTYISEPFQGAVYGAEAHALMLRQLFERHHLHKVYCDVYGHNTLSLRTLKNAGYQIEGSFREHCKNRDNSRSDLIRLSIFSSQKKTVIDFVDRITKAKFAIQPFILSS